MCIKCLGAVAHTEDVWNEERSPTVIDYVRCDGTEQTLLSCNNNEIEYHDLIYRPVAGVRCAGKEHTKNKRNWNCVKINNI